MLRRWVLAVIAGAVVVPAGALAAGAGKTIAPTKAERAGVLKSFGDPPRAWPCLVVRIAASNHNYGTVRFRMTHDCQKWAFNGVNVLERVGQSRWRIRFEASAYRCPIARVPRSVQRDLGVCPRT